MKLRFLTFLLFALAASLLFAKLGDRGLLETSEARYAETSREMYVSGDWITPRFFGIKHFHKPPLAYWLTEAGYALFDVNELGARFFLAVAALFTLGCVHRLGRIWFDERTAMLATALLTTSPLFVTMARLLTTDLYLTAATTAAVLGFAEGHAGRRRGYLAMWAAIGAGFLLKGPVVLLLVAPAIGAALYFLGKPGQWREMYPVGGPLLAAGVFVPWFVAVCVRNPGLLTQLVVFETVDRVASNVHNRPGPVYYFVGIFLVGFFPWSLLAPAAAIDRSRQARPLERVLACWFLVPFVAFSIVKSKLPPYILPLLPAASLYVAVWIESLLQGGKASRWATSTAIACSLATAVAVGLSVFVVRPEAIRGLSPHLLLFIPVLLLWAWSAHRTERTGRAATFLAGAAAVSLLYPVLISPFGDRIEGDSKSLRPVAEAIRASAGPDDPVVLCRQAATSIPFYLRRPVYTFEVDHDFKFEEDAKTARHWHFYEMDRIIEMLSRGPVYLLVDDDTERRIELARKPGSPKLRTLARAWHFHVVTNAR